jgi:ADP-heptose:LPS heptosyltransferase
VKHTAPPQNFLIVLPSNLGDVIMATPVLEGLKKKYKDSHIAFFVEEGFDAGIVENPCCDSIIRFARRDVRAALSSSGWREGHSRLEDTVRRVADLRFDYIINLSQPSYASFLTTLFNGANVLGQRYLRQGNHSVDDLWSQYLYSIPFYRNGNNLHAVDVYRRIAGVKSHAGGYTLVLLAGEKDQARGLLAEHGIDINAKIAIFQPGAALPSKCWPPECFVALGKYLAADGWKICVTGAASEAPFANRIAGEIGPCAASVAGKTTFRESMALLSHARACVTGDTAQMHASAALGVPTFAVFGPTNPVETGPYGEGHFVFSGHCPYMPCFKTECTSQECMKSISPEIVCACIRTGTVPKSPLCNVYKTTCRPDHDFALAPCEPDMRRYFHEEDVCLVRNIFDDRWNCLPGASSDFARGVAELGKWLEIVSDMCNALNGFEEFRQQEYVRKYERIRLSLSAFSGVGAFCTALLNIRLNSVPLLPPELAVHRTLEACWKTHKQIGKAIS